MDKEKEVNPVMLANLDLLMNMDVLEEQENWEELIKDSSFEDLGDENE